MRSPRPRGRIFPADINCRVLVPDSLATRLLQRTALGGPCPQNAGSLLVRSANGFLDYSAAQRDGSVAISCAASVPQRRRWAGASFCAAHAPAVWMVHCHSKLTGTPDFMRSHILPVFHFRIARMHCVRQDSCHTYWPGMRPGMLRSLPSQIILVVHPGRVA